MRAQHALLATALLLQPACGVLGGGYLSKDLACEHDAYDWYGDLTQYMRYGDVSGDVVDFAFPPYEGWINRVIGNYNTSTGDFTFRHQFLQEHWLNASVATGYGTVFENGDLDVLYDVTETDILDEVETYQVRHERSACEGTIRVSDPDDPDALPTTTTYTITSPAEVTSTVRVEDAGLDYTSTRTTTSDFQVSGTTDQTWSGGTASSTWTNDVDLNYRSEWTQSNADYDYVGTTTSDITGRTQDDYEVFEDGNLRAHITSNRAYDGSGSGTYTDFGQDLDCTVTYRANGSCTYDCGSAGTFDETDC